MNREEFIKYQTALHKRCLELNKTKNTDYATSDDPFKDFRTVEALGICSVETGILIRMCSKFARLTNLIGRGLTNKVADETVDDTLIDLANYAFILAAYRESLKKKKTSS